MSGAQEGRNNASCPQEAYSFVYKYMQSFYPKHFFFLRQGLLYPRLNGAHYVVE